MVSCLGDPFVRLWADRNTAPRPCNSQALRDHAAAPLLMLVVIAVSILAVGRWMERQAHTFDVEGCRWK
jgi:hypothetical protein